MFANNKMRENSGRLIKIYRERMHQGSKDKRFSCNEFILATREHPFYEVVEGEPVCSRATLNRLERGQIIKDDELYVFFIEKLGFKVDDFPGVMSQVELISAELFEAVELYDIRKIKEIDNKIETLFTKAKSYFYYSDIYEAFKIIIQYYLFAEYPNSVTAERMYYTSFLLSSKIDEILKNILFDYFFFREMNMSYSEKISEQLISYKNGSQISTIYIVFWLIYKERLLDALRYTELGIIYFTQLNSIYYLGILYYTKALALHTGNKDNVKNYFDRSIEYLSKCGGRLAEKKLKENYFNVGYHYYYDKDYLLAKEYFEKFLSYKPKFAAHILHVLECFEELNLPTDTALFKQIHLEDPNDNSTCKIFYEYFSMKINNASAKELQNFIMTDIHRLLINQYRSESILSYFKSELSKLVKITKKYKDIDSFNDFTSHKIA